MADEGKPPAGRGSGAGRGSQRKAKFAPTVPSQRRKKADEAGSSATGSTAAQAAAGNELFADLIRTAQAESKWQRGRGRGFGRGRGNGMAQVMFGGDGSDMRRTAAVPQPRPPPRPKGEGKGGVKQEAASDGSSKRRLKPNVKSDGKAGAAAAAEDGYEDDGGSGSEGGADLARLFDYEQYFPTTLPMYLHHPTDEEADAAADAGLMRQGLPQELALREDDAESATAAQLGLTDLSTAQDTLFLFQLPAVLPLGLPPADSRKARGAAAAAAGSSSGPPAPLRAAGVQELPSGPVGKLLVFKSGRVKLQMGSCLLDVAAGMPCVSRQDVAAINKSTGHIIQLGPVTQRAVVCPDVWQLMSNQEVPQFRRDLQQQQQQLQPRRGQAAAANGVGGGHDMDVDDDLEDGEELEALAKPRARVKKLLGSDEESEEGDGSNKQQQQRQRRGQAGQQQRGQRQAAHQLGSSSEEGDDGSKPPADAGVKQQEDPPADVKQPAAQQLPPQQQQQQPAQPVGNGGWGF